VVSELCLTIEQAYDVLQFIDVWLSYAYPATKDMSEAKNNGLQSFFNRLDVWFCFKSYVLLKEIYHMIKSCRRSLTLAMIPLNVPAVRTLQC